MHSGLVLQSGVPPYFKSISRLAVVKSEEEDTPSKSFRMQ
ncbi:hypothetical protein ES288_D08G078900v1 [Gossypium darwinii]|uniref:Uncharacterized protein n=2 Tax=Gossypium TaxID=3633 RepID=A0A5D2JRW0_GOSTO|nr:hypothetical protein ES288_D08G078900v1 [Gossypium darwinii]TYH57266.1 hypothetical protein ES332_D08G077800v1 [Gossypium tomentosum]